MRNGRASLPRGLAESCTTSPTRRPRSRISVRDTRMSGGGADAVAARSRTPRRITGMRQPRAAAWCSLTRSARRLQRAGARVRTRRGRTAVHTALMATATVTAAERILDGLSGAQREAVLHGAGPLLIIAGAGTGKTTVLTRRIAHLIASRRARPEEILALTFTEKAAAEMAERVDQLIPYGYAESWIGTFHAFGDRVLRDHG